MRKLAFTLVEIFFTVLIVGILATLTSLKIADTMEKARIKEAEVELQKLAAAVQRLAWDTGKWPNKAIRTQPGTYEVWDLTGPKSGLLGNDGAFTGWKGPYVDSIPLDPWGKPYFFDPDYRIDGVNYIVVGSFGPNKKGPNLYDDDDCKVEIDN